MSTTDSRGTAVVIGASMAGLSAAAVFASRFRHVVIAERDPLPATPGDRKGVPQGRHVHALLPAGLVRLEAWFPGLSDELVAAGARRPDLGRDGIWYQGGGYRVRFESGVTAPMASRALLEHHVRRRVLALPNVALRRGTAVTGITTPADRSTVNGVLLDDGTTLGADLVVDASGRQARSLSWLAELGYEAPATSEVKVDVAYATRVLRRDPDAAAATGWEFALVLAGPPSGRQGVAVPIEGDRWMVTLAGMHGERPPTDDAGFLAFARSLPSQEVARLLDTSLPLGPIVTHRTHSNRRRHVERLRRVPGGLVLLGDAICGFNPTYGQGMTTATLQAEALGHVLDRSPACDARFVRRYYRRAAGAISPAWQLTTGADWALPETTGPKAPGTDALNRYLPHVFRASQVSETVCRRVIEVTALLRRPPALLTPRMLALVLSASRRAPSAAPPAPDQPARTPAAAA